MFLHGQARLECLSAPRAIGDRGGFRIAGFGRRLL